jgi:hypothetical protein
MNVSTSDVVILQLLGNMEWLPCAAARAKSSIPKRAASSRKDHFLPLNGCTDMCGRYASFHPTQRHSGLVAGGHQSGAVSGTELERHAIP